MAVQVTMYVSESDKWQHRPLHLAVLQFLRKENVAGATVLHAVAGFTGRGNVITSSLIDAESNLPVVITFVDAEEHVARVLPTLKEMASHRLIVSEHVELVQGLD